MNARLATHCALAMAFAVSGVQVRAQTATDLLGQGVAAYRSLEYERATSLLRRSLAVDGSRALPDTSRVEALTYLAASELFCGRADSATSAFREGLALSPRYRPDTLIFPSRVMTAFEAARRATAFVRVRAPPDTAIVLGADRYAIQLFASGPHDVTVAITRPDGPRRVLFNGRIRDSLEVHWDGLDSAARPLDGNLLVHVRSTSPDGTVREVRVPLLVAQGHQAVSGTRAVSTARSVSASSSASSAVTPSRARGVLAAAAAAAAVIALPALVSDENGSRLRFAVVASVGTAGLLRLVRRDSRPTVATPRNPEVAWLRIVAGRQENVRSGGSEP